MEKLIKAIKERKNVRVDKNTEVMFGRYVKNGKIWGAVYFAGARIVDITGSSITLTWSDAVPGRAQCNRMNAIIQAFGSGDRVVIKNGVPIRIFGIASFTRFETLTIRTIAEFVVGAEYRDHNGTVIKCVGINKESDTVYFTGCGGAYSQLQDGTYPFGLSRELEYLEQGYTTLIS